METRYIVTCYLKTGLELTFECDSWNFSTNNRGDFVGYDFKKQSPTTSFDLKELLAYQVREKGPSFVTVKG